MKKDDPDADADSGDDDLVIDALDNIKVAAKKYQNDYLDDAIREIQCKDRMKRAYD